MCPLTLTCDVLLGRTNMLENTAVTGLIQNWTVTRDDQSICWMLNWVKDLVLMKSHCELSALGSRATDRAVSLFTRDAAEPTCL